MSVAAVTPQDLAKILNDGKRVDLIDVRTPAEYREVHVQSARNVPLDKIDAASLIKARGLPNEPLYIVCLSGNRSKMACEKFITAGFENVINVEGGTTACLKAGLPVVRGKKAMSLERQVRIAAGLLVLTGVGLSFFVHPACIGLSAFVGAGLVFAGISDTCGMGMILARMPWNQSAQSASSCNAA